MRITYLAIFALFLTTQLTAQAPLLDGHMQQYVSKQLDAKRIPASTVEQLLMDRAQKGTAEARGDGSYLVAYIDAVENSGSSPGLVRSPLWPDSLARIVDATGDFYWFIHAMSDVMDPNSLLINDLYIEDNISVQFGFGKIYDVTEFGFYYLYDRVSAPSIVDTLRVYIYGEANISEQNFTDWPGAGDVTDVCYARYNNGLFRPNTDILYTFEYLLTAADTSTALIANVTETISTTIAKNSKIGAAFHFIPGQTYSLGDVLFDNTTGTAGVLNNFDLITYYEDDGLFPTSAFTDVGALNQGGVVETTIRYGTNPLGWNTTYYPAFGFGPGWLSEHVLTEWRVKPIGAHFTAGSTGEPCEIQFSDRSNVGSITNRDWSYGDPAGSIAINEASPKFTYPANGTYNVNLAVSGAEGNFNWTRSVTVSNCAVIDGINDLDGLVSFDLFPSPATDFVTLNIALGTSQDIEIGFYNAHGQLVMSDRIQGNSDYRNTFDVSQLPAGLYQVKLQNGQKFSTKAFVIN